MMFRDINQSSTMARSAYPDGNGELADFNLFATKYDAGKPSIATDGLPSELSYRVRTAIRRAVDELGIDVPEAAVVLKYPIHFYYSDASAELTGVLALPGAVAILALDGFIPKEQLAAPVVGDISRLREVADELRRRVREELGLSISVGVSFNKIFAKLGSDYKKPDATTLISPENWQEIVWPLPVGAMLFVGRSAQRTLAQYGVETIGQLAACRPEMLEKLLGKLGRQLHEYANGLDRSPVRPQAEREPVKSVGNGTTFPHDLTRWEEVRAGLAALSDSVAMRLRRQGLYCSGVQVTIKDSSFCSISRQKRLESPTRLMKDIQRAAMELTRSAWRAPTPIRMLTVTALHITESAESFEQLDLLGAGRAVSDARQEKLESAVRAIRDKFGDGSITFGSGEPPGAKGN